MQAPEAPRGRNPRELQSEIQLERNGATYLAYRDDADRRIVVSLSEVHRLTLGRGSKADVDLGFDRGVSRLHAELRRTGGRWLLIDDGLSRNGTFVNDRRVGGRRRLWDQDLIRVGSTTLLFREHAAASNTARTASVTGSLPVAELTAAQRRVLLALCRPFRDATAPAIPASNEQIATELNIGVQTVKDHLRGLFAKFRVPPLPHHHKRTRLCELAVKSGAITVRDI